MIRIHSWDILLPAWNYLVHDTFECSGIREEKERQVLWVSGEKCCEEKRANGKEIRKAPPIFVFTWNNIASWWCRPQRGFMAELYQLLPNIQHAETMSNIGIFCASLIPFTFIAIKTERVYN
jgi:hypothetical protein